MSLWNFYGNESTTKSTCQTLNFAGRGRLQELEMQIQVGLKVCYFSFLNHYYS